MSNSIKPYPKECFIIDRILLGDPKIQIGIAKEKKINDVASCEAIRINDSPYLNYLTNVNKDGNITTYIFENGIQLKLQQSAMFRAQDIILCINDKCTIYDIPSIVRLLYKPIGMGNASKNIDEILNSLK